MMGIKRKVESVMNGEDNASENLLASALHAISLLYAAGLRLRQLGYRQKILPVRKLPCRVICVGNLAVGGTGKSPMTMYVAERIKHFGYRPAIVSRGYGGRAQNRGSVVSDGSSILMGPELAGDEPCMMAGRLKDVPVVVGKDRFAAGMLALDKFKPDVIVLDDGFQHLALKRDVDLVLLDHLHAFGNMHLLPRGILREPISALQRATACILTRYRPEAAGSTASAVEMIKKYAPHLPVLTSTFAPYCYTIRSGTEICINAGKACAAPMAAGWLDGAKTFGFSGIARNRDFQDTVKNIGVRIAGFMEFEDHRPYSAHDLKRIASAAVKANARRLITTEKDLVRIPPENPFNLDLVVVGLRVSFGSGEQDFNAFLKDQLAACG